MRRPTIVAFAIVASLLVVTATPAAASSHTNTAVGSIHTTDTDFNAATTLENVSVSGSGASASVAYSPASVFGDGFENEPADAGLPDNWEQSRDQGTNSFEVTTALASAGTQSAHITHSGSGAADMRPAEQPYGSAITNNVSLSIRGSSGTEASFVKLFETGSNRLEFGIMNGNLVFWNGSYSGLDTGIDNGEWVSLSITNIDPAADEVTLTWSAPDGDSGTQTVAVNGDMNGFTATPVSTDDGDTYVDEFSIGEESGTGSYVGAAHGVNGAISGFTDLANVNDVSVEVTWQENASGSWQDIRTDTYTTAGNKTVDISAATSSSLRVNVTVVPTGANPSVELDDEGVQFTNHAPEPGNASAAVLEQNEYGLHFDDPDDETVIVPNDSSIDGLNEYTFAFQARPTDLQGSTGGDVFMSKGMPWSTGGFAFVFQGNGKLRFQAGNASGSDELVRSDSAPPLDEWMTVVGTVESDGTMTLYLDGKPQSATGSVPGTVTTSSDDIEMMSFNNAEGINGSLDDAVMDDRAWTAAEVEEYHKNGTVPSDTVSHWRFNSGSGSTAVDSAGSNDGTINGAEWTEDIYIPAADQLDASGFNQEAATLALNLSDREFATLQGDEVTATWYLDGSSVGSDTVTRNQTIQHRVTNLADGSHNWHVELADSYGGTATSSTFSFTVEHYDPVFNNASASPQGNAETTDRQVTLEIPVNDTDFAEPSGDSITVNFTVDGSAVGSDTLAANGTASVTTTISTGGPHSWSASAEDEYGLTATSDTFTFQSPDELRILNESSPTELVDNATVELRFFVDEGSGAPQVYTRNTSDGTVNMTGLPADKPFIVVAEADGYFSRRIFVPSLYQTQRVYLLPDNATAVPVSFGIEDYTGEFDSENTVLLVQRALNGSYRTVLGDYFGATGQFPATLAYNQRHRLVLLNVETGERRSLGAYTPQSTSSQRVVVSPAGDINFIGIPPTISLPDTSRLPATTGVPFTSSIQNGSLGIQSWSLTISANGTTLFTDSGSGSASISTGLDLTAYAGGQVNATMTYTLTDGSSDSITRTYTISEAFDSDDSLLGSLNALVTLVPAGNQSAFTMFIAMVVTILGTAGIVSKVPMTSEFVGVVAWLFIAGFAILGWVSYDLLFVAGVAAASFAYLRRVN